MQISVLQWQSLCLLLANTMIITHRSTILGCSILYWEERFGTMYNKLTLVLEYNFISFQRRESESYFQIFSTEAYSDTSLHSKGIYLQTDYPPISVWYEILMYCFDFTMKCTTSERNLDAEDLIIQSGLSWTKIVYLAHNTTNGITPVGTKWPQWC